MSFKLFSKDLKKLKPGDILNLTDVEDKQRKKLHDYIQSVLNNLKKLAKASCGLKTDHVERGKRIIDKGLKHF